MIILPRKNEKDLRDIPEEIRKQIKLVLWTTLEQVLEAALRRKPVPLVADPVSPPRAARNRTRNLKPETPVRRHFPPPVDHPRPWPLRNAGWRPGPNH